MSSGNDEVQKLEAVKRSLAIANRVTSAAIVDAKKRKRTAKSMSGGKRKRSASPKSGKRKKSPCKRKKSPGKKTTKRK